MKEMLENEKKKRTCCSEKLFSTAGFSLQVDFISFHGVVRSETPWAGQWSVSHLWSHWSAPGRSPTLSPPASCWPTLTERSRRKIPAVKWQSQSHTCRDTDLVSLTHDFTLVHVVFILLSLSVCSSVGLIFCWCSTAHSLSFLCLNPIISVWSWTWVSSRAEPNIG